MAENKDVVITDMDDPYIRRLEAEKDALEQRIKELQVEVRAINNLIYRKKSEAFAESTGQTPNLKNVDRLFFETVILDALRSSTRGLRTREIYDALAKKGYGMNYNTLRSYVTKMRDKALIQKKTPNSYYWVAKAETPTPAAPSSR